MLAPRQCEGIMTSLSGSFFHVLFFNWKWPLRISKILLGTMYRYILRYKLLRLNYRFVQVTYKIVTNILNSVIPMRKYEMAFNLLQ